jgi:hypothetical protein
MGIFSDYRIRHRTRYYNDKDESSGSDFCRFPAGSIKWTDGGISG